MIQGVFLESVIDASALAWLEALCYVRSAPQFRHGLLWVALNAAATWWIQSDD